jgi:hypothetical protein
VHKANLGSQLSIFDTGSFARAHPRPNDPPERVHAGALKRPARTTETKRQGRAGQTSCTSVHKANLGSQLSIFDTGSSAGRALARTTRPNEFTRAPSNDPPERPKRSDKGEPGKRAARACTKPTSGHNLAFLIRARSARARPRPNDPPERVHAGALKRPARTTETKRQGRAGQTSCTSVHKANLGSQLSIFNTGSFARARPRPKRAPSNDPPGRALAERTRAPSNDPPERAQTGALKRPARTTHPNDPPERVHTGALKRPALAPSTTHPNDPPERPARTSHTGALKRPARTTHPNEFTRAPSNDPPERPTRTTRPNEFTRAPSNDPPERFCRTGELTRESWANELHERAQSQPRVTT